MRTFEVQFSIVCALMIGLQVLTGQERHPRRKWRECRARLAEIRSRPEPEPEPEPEPTKWPDDCTCTNVTWVLLCEDCGAVVGVTLPNVEPRN